MWELFKTVGGDLLPVDLIALAIIEILGCQKLSTLVASGAVCVPDFMDCQEFVIWVWLSSAVDVHSSTVVWLPWLVLRKSDVAILLIAKSH